MARERLVYMDVAKCIAIFLVCTGHAYFLSPLGNSSKPCVWIYSFHMPLFMLLCGFFSINSFKLPPKEFLLKKCKALLLPVLSFTLLSCIIYLILNVPNLSTVCKSELIGGMWFLRTLFFCYIIVYAIKRTRLPDWLCCLVSCLALMAIPKGSFLQTNYLLLFFWTGFFMNKYKDLYYKYRLYVTVVALIVYMLWGRTATPEVLGYDFLSNLMAVPKQYITALTLSLELIGVVYYFSRLSSLSFLVRRMSNIGQYTLGIYGVQTILLERISYSFLHGKIMFFDTTVTDYVLIPVIGIIYCLISYKIVRLTKRWKICNLALYGNQYH